MHYGYALSASAGGVYTQFAAFFRDKRSLNMLGLSSLSKPRSGPDEWLHASTVFGSGDFAWAAR
jgi:hypothetical protein